MIPVLGEKYAVDIKETSRPIETYNTDEYFELDLPVAPAVMVGDEILVEGTDVSKQDLESEICRQLRLPPPEFESKRFLKKLFNRVE